MEAEGTTQGGAGNGVQRRWLLPAGLFTTLAVFLAVTGVPFITEWRQLRSSIVALRAQIEEKAGASRELRDLTSQAQAIGLEVQHYDRLVPPTQDKGSFYTDLSKALDVHGLREENRAMLAPTRLGKCQALPMELHARGKANQFIGFLQALESLPRMSSVSRLVIEADSALDGEISANLVLSIYSTFSATGATK